MSLLENKTAYSLPRAMSHKELAAQDHYLQSTLHPAPPMNSLNLRGVMMPECLTPIVSGCNESSQLLNPQAQH